MALQRSVKVICDMCGSVIEDLSAGYLITLTGRTVHITPGIKMETLEKRLSVYKTTCKWDCTIEFVRPRVAGTAAPEAQCT